MKLSKLNKKKDLILGWKIPRDPESVKNYIETGIHSGIPWCCVYWITYTAPTLSLTKLKVNTKSFWQYVKRNSPDGGSNGYHACPDCIKANWAKQLNFCCTVHRAAGLNSCDYKVIPEIPNRKKKAYFGLPLGHKAYAKLTYMKLKTCK